DDPAAFPGLRAGEQGCYRGGPGLGGTRRAVDSLELEGALPSSAVVEQPLVDDELDTRLAQGIGEPDGELARHARAPEAQGLGLPDDVGRCEVVEVDAVADEVVDGEGLRVENVDRRIDGCDAVAFDAPRYRDAPAAHLGVEQHVDDVDGDLVAQLGAALRVTEDQDVGHAVEPTVPRVGWQPWSRPSSTCGHASPRSPI